MADDGEDQVLGSGAPVADAVDAGQNSRAIDANTSGAGEGAPIAPAEPSSQTAQYSMSPGLVGWMTTQHLSLAISSYQSGKFYLLGRNPQGGGLMVHERFFHKAMGIAVADRDIIFLATLQGIARFENVLLPGEVANKTHDACFVPRTLHVTGAIDLHDVGLLEDGRPVFVNTLYNCLATLSERHSFRPLWMPPFISRLVKEDRCHLNGLAMDQGKPAYVTACSRSDTIDGWRDRRVDGGVIIEVETGRIVAEGLSMPHSPRVHNGQLYVLNSGTGEIGRVNTDKEPASAFEPIAFCPGFVRGLALVGRFAVVGLSKPRYQRFEGLALDDRLRAADSEPWCGVQVIDLVTGACVQWFRIDGAISELYDIGLVPNVSCPMALGFGAKELLTLITHEALD